MTKSILFLLALFGLGSISKANDQMREWTLATGAKQQAEILSYDEPRKVVTLRLPNQKEVQMDEQKFSSIDRAWVLQWVEQDEEARDLLTKIGGTVTEHTGTGNFTTAYSVYQPAAAAEGAKGPMLILFHPGGNGRRAIYKYIEAASKVGLTLVSLDHFRNTGNDPAKEAEMLERFTALLPQIEATVPHDETRMFMGGVSGGAWRSYHYSAQVPRPWAGIFACGGWLGGKIFYHLEYPAMRVAMVNGDKDAPANQYVDPDTACLQRTGSIVSIHAFEGGHQLAPPSVQEKAFRWLLNDKTHMEAE
jgi:poly(3-hydroxybutyrate) depolymerase